MKFELTMHHQIYKINAHGFQLPDIHAKGLGILEYSNIQLDPLSKSKCKLNDGYDEVLPPGFEPLD